MKILSAAQIAQIDAITCEEQHIASSDLMDRAAHTVFLELKKRYQNMANQHFTIICGKGNNGGDGLVLARILDDNLAEVNIYLVKSADYSSNNLINQKKISDKRIQFFSETDDLAFPKDTIVLDCLFGSGLREELNEKWNHICNQINQADVVVYAIDMPSGLVADHPTSLKAPVIHADLVYTFQVPKLSLLMPQNQSFYDDFQVLDIQLSTRAIELKDSNMNYVTEDIIWSCYKKRKRFEHKGNFGHILIIGGSKGKMGAVQFALKAALRSGCGLATAYTPSNGNTIIQTVVPEAMLLLDDHSSYITNIPQLSSYQAIGIGVGLGTAVETVKAFSKFLKSISDQPIVVDADALNILAINSEWWSAIPPNSILTPHPKELSRIIGTWADDWDKLEKVKKFAHQYQLHILVKGANSSMVMADGTIFFNSTGNVGMATGGSGDVLTGILTALLGQGYPPQQALILGVYIHGRAADIAVPSIGKYSLLPSDIISFLPHAFLELEKNGSVISR